MKDVDDRLSHFNSLTLTIFY